VLSEWLKSAAMRRRQIAAKAVAGKRWSLVTGRYRPILLKKVVLRQPVGQVRQLSKWLQATSSRLSAFH